jgi:hypothetical protein
MQDLDAIMDSRPAEGQVEGQEQQQRDDGRDQRGRFTARQQAEQDQQAQQQVDPTQQQQQEPDKPPPGFIPQQAFDARMAKAEEKFNERYSALEGQLQNAMRQLAQFQHRPPQAEAPKPPDFFENPDAAFEARLREAISPLQRGQTSIVENFSKMLASDKFGEQAVNQAMAELTARVNANPQGMHPVYQRIMANPHPYGELVRWHKEQAALKTYGDDPEAYIKAELERRLAAQGDQQQPPQQQGQQQQMPTSFANARNSGPRAAVAFSGPKPLSEIMGGR